MADQHECIACAIGAAVSRQSTMRPVLAPLAIRPAFDEHVEMLHDRGQRH